MVVGPPAAGREALEGRHHALLDDARQPRRAIPERALVVVVRGGPAHRLVRRDVVVDRDEEVGPRRVGEVRPSGQLVRLVDEAIERPVDGWRVDVAVGAAREEHVDAGSLEHARQAQADVEVVGGAVADDGVAGAERRKMDLLSGV